MRVMASNSSIFRIRYYREPKRANFFFGRGLRTLSKNDGKLMTGLYPFW